MTKPAAAFEFSPAGLPGYIVRKSAPDRWSVLRAADGFCLEVRHTCKGAVAAAHADATFRANLAAGIKPGWMLRAEEIGRDGEGGR